jgi:hypothetical protein
MPASPCAIVVCDRSSNNSMAGAGMRLLEQAEHPELITCDRPE